MIRLLKIFSQSNRIRCTQSSVRQLCSRKSDDPTGSSSEVVLEEFDTSPELKTSEKHFNYSKYSRSENYEFLTALIENLPSDPRQMNLDSLKEFYENIKGYYLITPAVIKHPKFTVLREATEAHLPQLNTKEIKNILTAIIPSKALMHDKLSKMIVDAMLKRVTYLPFDQIIFLDFMLRKCYNVSELSKDYNILRLTLQTMFLSKVEDSLNELDGENDLEELMKIVNYCENNAEIIPMKITNRVTTSLLLIDDDKQFSINHITSVLIMLASLGKLYDHVEKLLQKMFGLWYQSEVEAYQVQVLLRILAAKKATIDKDRFKNPEFIRHCVNVVIQQADRNVSFSVLSNFIKLDFESQELIEHASKYFNEDLRELTVSNYITICTACARANYTPTNWESNVLAALKTFKFDIYLDKFHNFDWAEFALNFNQIGHCDTQLIRKIVKSKVFQSQKCYDKNKVEKLIEILEREGALSSDESDSESSDSDDSTADDELPLYDDLRNMFGVSKIWTNFQLDHKSTIPYMLKMDLQTGDFLPFSKPPSIRRMNKNELLIGINIVPADQWNNRNKLKFAKKQCRRMGEMGISSIIIEESKWNSLKAYEKSLVFYTKVVNLMESYRKNKLTQMIDF